MNSPFILCYVFWDQIKLIDQVIWQTPTQCLEMIEFVCLFFLFWSLEMINYIYYLLLQSDATLGLRQPEADGVRVWRGAVKLRVSDRGM